jgi:hypothetical protein
MVGAAAARAVIAMAVMSTCFDADLRILTAGIFLILLFVVRASEKSPHDGRLNGPKLGAPDLTRRSWASFVD